MRPLARVSDTPNFVVAKPVHGEINFKSLRMAVIVSRSEPIWLPINEVIDTALDVVTATGEPFVLCLASWKARSTGPEITGDDVSTYQTH